MKPEEQNRGWIKSYRRLTKEWEWWDDHNTTRLWTYLLHEVNYEEKRWRGVLIKPGQLVTGLFSLAKETGLSVQNIRTSLGKLKSTSEITIKSTSQFSIITICKWGDYQHREGINQQANQQASQQTTNKRLTTTKEIKKERTNIIEGEPLPKSSLSWLLDNELQRSLKKKYPYLNVRHEMKKAHDYYLYNGGKQKNGKKIKDYNRAAINWMNRQEGYRLERLKPVKPDFSAPRPKNVW